MITAANHVYDPQLEGVSLARVPRILLRRLICCQEQTSMDVNSMCTLGQPSKIQNQNKTNSDPIHMHTHT